MPARLFCLLSTAAAAAVAATTAPQGGIVTANVRLFGAVGDGKTDDIAAVERALAAVQATGGTLFFPAPGAYAISRALVVTGAAITLRGGGMVSSGSCATGWASRGTALALAR